MNTILGNFGKNHIILEGADGCGKTALINEMEKQLISLSFDVVRCKNPSSPELYQKLHSGTMSQFDIAMNTLADMWENYQKIIHKARKEEKTVILQDRSALISAQVYNLPSMSMAEFDIWYQAAQNLYLKYYRTDAQFVLLTNQPHRQEENVFSSNDNYSAYQNLIRGGGYLWTEFYTFSSEGNIEESAKRLLKELGYDA